MRACPTASGETVLQAINSARSETPSARRKGHYARHRRVSLCETLDRVLNKGAVIGGDVIISVAGVDLVYLGLNLVLSSVETMRRWSDAGARLPAGMAAGRDPHPADLRANSPG